MPATLHRFRSKQDRLTDQQAEELRQGLLALGDRLGLPENPLGRVLAAIDRRTASASGWTFVMLSPAQNSAVVEHLAVNSTRPQAALRLWALLFTALRTDTGEIVLSRQEISDALGIAPKHVSEIMTELERINAIQRQRAGRGVRYFMNPNVATHTSGADRDAAQRAAGQLSIFDVIEGGRAP